MACFGEVGEKTAGEAGDHGGHVGGDGVDLAWEAVKLRFFEDGGCEDDGCEDGGCKDSGCCCGGVAGAAGEESVPSIRVGNWETARWTYGSTAF